MGPKSLIICGSAHAGNGQCLCTCGGFGDSCSAGHQCCSGACNLDAGMCFAGPMVGCQYASQCAPPEECLPFSITNQGTTQLACCIPGGSPSQNGPLGHSSTCCSGAADINTLLCKQSGKGAFCVDGSDCCDGICHDAGGGNPYGYCGKSSQGLPCPNGVGDCCAAGATCPVAASPVCCGPGGVSCN